MRVKVACSKLLPRSEAAEIRTRDLFGSRASALPLHHTGHPIKVLEIVKFLG